MNPKLKKKLDGIKEDINKYHKNWELSPKTWQDDEFYHKKMYELKEKEQLILFGYNCGKEEIQNNNS